MLAHSGGVLTIISPHWRIRSTLSDLASHGQHRAMNKSVKITLREVRESVAKLTIKDVGEVNFMLPLPRLTFVWFCTLGLDTREECDLTIPRRWCSESFGSPRGE